MSIKKVASVAGVSIATVSRFFNSPNQVSKQTRKKVEEAIKRLDYRPNTLAQNLRRGKTGLIIVVIPKISSPLYESIIKQLNKTAKENDYHILVKEAEFNSLPLDYYQQMIHCKQADGFVLLVGLSDQNKDKTDNNTPVVLACEPHHFRAGSPHLPCMAIDYQNAAEEATQYLIHLGHTNIAFIAHNYQTLTISEQQSGFQSAMTNANLSLSGRLIDENESNLKIQQKLKKLLQVEPKLTAILCSDDETAIELLHYIKTIGLKVPEDISVMGFNNVGLTETSDPPLTTVNQPMVDIGREAINALLLLIDRKPLSPQLKNFKHAIVVRNSTSCPSH